MKENVKQGKAKIEKKPKEKKKSDKQIRWEAVVSIVDAFLDGAKIQPNLRCNIIFKINYLSMSPEHIKKDLEVQTLLLKTE